jgi:hypothetical protein
MSNAIVYFGAPTKDANSVGEEARNLGLEFLRESPSRVNTTVALQYIQPGHAIYKRFLPTFIKYAKEKVRISTRVPPYHPINHTILPPFVKLPVLIWSYNHKMAPEQIDVIKNDFEAQETSVKNKMAFRAPVKSSAWLTKLMDTKPILVTPSGGNEINISSFFTYLALGRIIDAFSRTNQYAAFPDNDKAHVGRFCGIKGIEFATKSTELDEDGTR